ncbi:unnamed protein product, partial [Oikopleura dioica]
MNSRQSPSIEADKKRMELIRQQWIMLKDEREFDKINGEIITYFLGTLILGKITRPDLFTTWSGSIRRALEEEMGLPLTSHAALCIKRWASEQARKVAEGKLYEPDQAVAIEPTNLTKLVDYLWFRQWTNLSFKQSALVAYICAHTGARCNEVVCLYAQDLEWRDDRGQQFLRMPLRSSKSNAFKTRREALVLPVPPSEKFPFKHWLSVILKGRAHYVVQALKAGANESDIVAVCRWKDEAMLNTYRMRQLECTKAGPAFKIFEKKDNAGVNIDLSTAQPGNSAKVEADIIDLSVEIQRPSKQEPTKARQQATIKIVRQTRTAATQTDQVYEARDQAIATPTLSPEAYESWELFLKKKRVKYFLEFSNVLFSAVCV